MRICSPITVTHGSKTLLTAGTDFLEGNFRVDGGQTVQAADLVGGATQARQPRGNERHVIQFTRVRRYASAVLAVAAVLNGAAAANVSRAKGSATIAISGGSTFTLADAVVESWPAEHLVHGYYVAQTFRITGGALT